MVDPVTDETYWRSRSVLAGEAREVRLPPIPEISELDGFRIAAVFDEPTPDGQPRVDPARGLVTDVEERRRLLGFLLAGRVAIDTGTASVDLLDPRRIVAVPNVFRTDGAWIWSDTVAYYLRWHLIPPQPEFWAHIRECGYRPAPVADDVAARAAAARYRATELRQPEIDRWLVAAGHLAPPSRFPLDFQQRLLGLGWTPGRDVSAEVDPWLRDELARFAGVRFSGRAAGAYEAFPAALAVLHEFGGLRSADNGPGVTSARVPFRMVPGRTWDTEHLGRGVADAVEYGGLIGQRVFQVGAVEDGTVTLAVAEDGSVHFAGAVQRFVGDTFDDALVGMLTGELYEEPEEDAGFDWDPGDANR